MSLRGTFTLARLAPIALLAWQAVTPTAAYSREVFKVTMADVLKEMNKMRQDLRELKIQRDRDQRVIEQLRQIVENSIPELPVEGPHPSVALPLEEAPKAVPVAPPVHIVPPPPTTGGGGPAAVCLLPRKPATPGVVELSGVNWDRLSQGRRRVAEQRQPPRKTGRLVVQNEGDLQAHAVFSDLAFLNHHFLVLHPSTLYVVQGLASAVDACFHGVVKTLAGAGDDLRYAGD